MLLTLTPNYTRGIHPAYLLPDKHPTDNKPTVVDSIVQPNNGKELATVSF